MLFVFLCSCEGRCRRSFHPTAEAGADSLCVSVGFLPGEVDVATASYLL